MENFKYNIGICGTFDVENYGDLLFPLIAEVELKKRLKSVNLYRFSYYTKNKSDWPFLTTSITELPHLIGSMDGLLIGGGHIIRFDKNIAPNYYPPTSSIHHPVGYWLTPALIALQHGTPVIWNSPSLDIDIPNWAQLLVKLVLENSSYISVRDQLSKDILSNYVDQNIVNIVPDTVFGISQLIDQENPSPEFRQLRKTIGLNSSYIVIQATKELDVILKFIKKHPQTFENLQILALPIGPALGDTNEILKDIYPDVICLPTWPKPLMISELICHAAAVVGQSLHLSITAFSFGIPIFSSAPINSGKYKILSSFENLYLLPKNGEISPEWFTNCLNKKGRSPKILEVNKALNIHWDHIASIIREGKKNNQAAIDKFWEFLPQTLENYELSIIARDEQLKLVYNSRLWKIASLLRSIISILRNGNK